MRKVPAKELPIPTTVSPELAKVIAQPIQVRPNPRSAEEWRAAQRAADGLRADQAKKLASDLGVKVEDTTLGGVKCFAVTPRDLDPRNEGRLLVHVHGGAYVFGAGLAGVSEAVLVAHTFKARAISVDYRMPPDHPFPAALDDAVAVWRAVTKERDAAKVALFGTSTGGGLTMATVLKLKQLGEPLPGAIFLGTPWTDLTKTGDTYFTCAEIDNVLGRFEGLLEGAARLYAGGADLKDPFLSPVYGDVRGFPPTILISGTRDLFLSITVRAHRKLRAAGVTADLHVFEGQSHADYLRSYPSPEADEALGEIARFFDAHLKR
jgi:acetyl esterase/lipase